MLWIRVAASEVQPRYLRSPVLFKLLITITATLLNNAEKKTYNTQN